MQTQVIARRLKRSWRQVRGTLFRNLMALLVALTHVILIGSPIGQRLENFAQSIWFRLRGPIAPPSNIEVISVDEKSYKAFKLSTLEAWPRSKQAELIEMLSSAGAKLVVLDFFMIEPGKSPSDNDKLANAMKKIPTFIGSYRKWDNLSNKYEDFLPQAIFSNAAAKVVNLNVLNEGQVIRFHLDKQEDSPKPFIYDFAVFVNKTEIPSSFDSINYYGPPGTIHATSAYDALTLSSEDQKRLFNGKIVFIGTQITIGVGLAMKDSFYTPVSSLDMSGVEIHAVSAGNILEQNWIKRAPTNIENLCLNLAAFSLCLLIVAAKPLRGLLVMLLVQASWFVLSFQQFLHFKFMPGFTLCFITLPYMLCIASIYYFFIAMRSHSEIEDALGVKIHLNE